MPPPSYLPDGKPPSRISFGESFVGRRILVVEPQQALPRTLRGVAGAQVFVTQFHTLDHRLIARVQPEVVLAPLFAPDHDILDVARRLDRFGYTGALCAYSPPLPDTALVRAEVRQIWGDRVFEIFEIPRHHH